MGSKTRISWTGSTWNFLRGCSREIAEGATTSGCGDATGGGCYAEATGGRFCGPGLAYEGLVRITAKGARWTGRVDLIGEHLLDPLRWQKPRRIFVASVSDPFHPKLSNEVIAGYYAIMWLAGRHTFQNLTKRARRRRDWFVWAGEMTAERLLEYGRALVDAVIPDQRDAFERAVKKAPAFVWPLPNVWEGASVEHQPAADERIPALLATPAAVRFLSIEPLIGPVTLPIVHVFGGYPKPPSIDWVIVGCESGHRARPCEVEWIRALRDQCADAGVAFFLKQAVDVMRFGPRGVEHTGITFGPGTEVKGRAGSASVLERPYLDGEQWLEFPEVRHG